MLKICFSKLHIVPTATRFVPDATLNDSRNLKEPSLETIYLLLDVAPYFPNLLQQLPPTVFSIRY